MNFQKILAGFLIGAGVVFFLQGINILPGSFMTGDLRWAVVGIVALIAGLVFWRGKASQ